MADRRSVLLAAASTVAALLLCETGLRIARPFGPRQRAVSAPAAPSSPSDLKAVNQYVGRLPVVAGTDPAWFLEDPPALPNRGKPSPADVAKYEDFARRKIYPPQAQYIWNSKYLASRMCTPDGAFAPFPSGIPVFDPADGAEVPRYRFPPSSTLPSGLVTNRFGMRGPEVEPVKPPRTIRIAFVGASTTIHVHDRPFSYPERVVDWLNRYARARRLEVKFEGLNAGREGIGSADIAAIVRHELVPLDPDLVVYYEGANQFLDVRTMAQVEPGGQPVPPEDRWAWFRERTAVGDLLARAGVLPSPTGEPPKARHKLVWPETVDPRSPDPDNPNLPAQLPAIVRDLDAIRDAVRPGGGRLVLSSFLWLAADRLRISQAAHPHIWRYLNEMLLPLTYAEVRRIADFQNQVLREYARKRGIDFLDVASRVPQDPALFSDAVHLLEPGERLKAWIFFQQLAPLVRREIDAGRLPRQSAPGVLPQPVSFPSRTLERNCKDPAAAK
jgi:hypothetical protein